MYFSATFLQSAQLTMVNKLPYFMLTVTVDPNKTEIHPTKLIL